MDLLQKNWFAYVAQHPDWVDTNVTALFFAISFRRAQLGRDKFQLPALDVMERIGIRSPKTYYPTLEKLETAGFISILEKSRNQYSACIIQVNEIPDAPVKITSAPTIAPTLPTTSAPTEPINASVDAEVKNTETTLASPRAEVGATVGASVKNALARETYIESNTSSNEESIDKESNKENGGAKKASVAKPAQATIVAPPPSASLHFQQVWQSLLQAPKWKGKPASALELALTKLLRYEEAFAVLLMEKAIMGNNQGVVFEDTDLKYQQWQKGQRQHRTVPAGRITTTATQPAYFQQFGSPGRVFE